MTFSFTSDAVPLDAGRIFETLVSHDVRFVVVGGLAAIAHGYSATTRDADTVPALDDENLTNLASALAALDARLYAHPERRDLLTDGAPPEALDFTLTCDALKRQLVWHFMTAAGGLDILFVIDGPGGYDELRRHAEARRIRDFEILIASLDDLIDAKETAGRDKDLRALDELRRLRDRRT